MDAVVRGRVRWGRLLLAVSAWVLFAGAIPVDAQGRGGGGGRGGRPPKPPPKQPPKKDSSSGSEKGWLVKFKPAREGEEDEDLLGTLSVKGFERDSRVVKLTVRRFDGLTIKVRDHTFDPDELREILWKGLHCTARWQLRDPDSRRKIKELQSLSFDTLQIKGKIYQIEDGMVIIRGVPKGGRQWPDVEAREKDNPGGSRRNAKAKRIARRKVKLKILEDVSLFQDAGNEELDLDEFEVGQEVEATVVYGRPYGMMIAMRMPSDGDEVEDDGRGRGGRGRGGRGR